MKKPGYVFILTLMMLSVSTILVTQIFFQGHLYNLFVPVIVQKEKARQLAVSGASIALAQLSLQDARFASKQEAKPGAAQEKKDSKKEREQRSKQLLKTLLTVQNRWQKFVLTHELDGIDAQLSVCITCEDGKVNINHMYDFKTHEFVKVPQASLKDFFAFLGTASKPFTKNKNMFELVQEVLKKRKGPLVDVTQLLQTQQLELFKDNIFYTPSESPFAESDAKKETVPKIYLADLLTVDTDSFRINPWVLSSSMQLLFKMKPRQVINEKEFQKEIEELLEKVSLGAMNWEKDWDTYLKPLYKVDYESIPKEVRPFLSTKFEPRLFSVLCYARVGQVTEKLLVVLERNAIEQGESISLKKMYWL